ncbi:MAG TPA: hypothetical protein VMS31_19040, partial [Pyrinomonadaceae bacterium]|nr:hypothetical protein [Pyrinomonadaceae bacterium]
MTQQKAVGLAKGLIHDQHRETEAELQPQTRSTSAEFQIEIDQLVVVKKVDSLVQAWCVDCKAEGHWVTPEHAAIISNSDTRSIYRRVEGGTLHFLEQSDGLPLVCLNSLF